MEVGISLAGLNGDNDHPSGLQSEENKTIDFDKYKDNDILSVIMFEYSRVKRNIRSTMERMDRMLGLGFTIMGTGFAFGIRYDILEVIVFVPLGISVLVLYAGGPTLEVMSLGGYARHLEERINQCLGNKNELIWELLANKHLHRTNIPAWSASIGGSIIVISLGYIGYGAAEKLYGEVGSIIYLIVMIFSLSAIALSLMQIGKAHGKSYRESKKLYKYNFIVGLRRQLIDEK